MQVGFIGLGFLGSRVARGIVDGGFDTVLYDVNPDAMRPFIDANVRRASSIDEVAKAAEIVGICVVDDAQVEEVVSGPNGILNAPMQPGSIIVVHSTVSPLLCRQLEERAAAVGVSLIDAALTGNHSRETRVVLVGGDAETLERCLPVFESFATRERIQHVGPTVGSGEVAKIVNNLLLWANMGTAAAALDLGERLGVSRVVIEDTLTNGSGTSQGIKSLLTPSVEVGSFHALGIKDVTLAIQVAESAGLDVSELAGAAQAGLATMKARASGD